MTEFNPALEKYFRTAFDGVIRIEVEGGGSYWIDGRVSPPGVSEQAPQGVDAAFCLWRTSADTLRRILSPGARQLEAAYIAGRLAISGDMAVMARLQPGEKGA